MVYQGVRGTNFSFGVFRLALGKILHGRVVWHGDRLPREAVDTKLEVWQDKVMVDLVLQ